MTQPAGPNDDVLQPSGGAGDSGWDDDVWGDEGDPPDRRTVLFVQIGLVLVIVAIVAAVLIFKNNDDKDDTAKGGTGSGTSSPVTDPGAPATGGGPTEPAPLVWPVNVGGRPAAFGELNGSPAAAPGGAAPGVYLWSDYDGWHLWVVHGEGVGDINGTVTGDDVIASADVTPAESGVVTVADKVIAFDLKSDEAISGFDFNPGFYAKRLEFVLNGPDGPVPAEVVHVGKDAVPAPSPIIIEKAPGG